LSEKIKTAFIFNPNLTFKHLLETVLHELKIPAAGQSTSSLLGGLNEFLKERMAEGENVLIVIDEGQDLANKVLRDLDRLYQQVPSGVNALQTLLVGQLELETKLNSEELREFKQRVAIQKQISLLDLQESRQYIDHRLRVVGSSSSKVFTPEAVEVICEYAKGVPRVINLICDGALFAGYDASAPVIDDHMVKKAIAENEITIEKAPFSEGEVIAGTENYFESGQIFQGKTIQKCLDSLGLPAEKMESVHLAADYSLRAEGEVEAQVDKKRDDVIQKRGRSERRASPRKKALFAIGCLLVVILFGLTPALFRTDRPRQSATQETPKEQPSQAGGGTEPVKEHSVAEAAPSEAKRQLHSRETGTGSVPSLQREDPGREQGTKVSKKAGARSERIGGQKPIGQAALSGSSKQSMTDSLPQRTGPIETGKVLHERGEFSSGDQKASVSEISRTAEESQKKEAEEIDSGKAIDWLLKKRSEKKNQE
jgi:type II secretory pathway predicted ATPase ExeA